MSVKPVAIAERPHRAGTVVILGLTALGLAICAGLTAPFVSALAWALAFAVLAWPLHRWLERRLRHPGAAALLSVVISFVCAGLILLLVGQRLAKQAVVGVAAVEAGLNSAERQLWLESRPQLARWVARIEPHLDLAGTFKSLAAWLGTYAGSFLRGSMVQIAGFFLVFYLMFFLLRDRRLAINWLRHYGPFTDPEMDRLVSGVEATIRATAYGLLVIAAVQGFLGGLMFWWLDLPAPLWWGLMMALAALVPMLGASLVWVPAAAYLAVTGRPSAALVLALWGAAVVGLIDNVLRPILVGGRLKLHAVPIFISVVGGIVLFGPAGLVMGPLAVTVTLALLEISRARYVVTHDAANIAGPHRD